MRLVAIADIHDNLTALEAVLADMASLGPVDHIWVLGDLVLGGARPGSCVGPVRALPKARVIRGNADRYLATGSYYPWPAARDADEFQELVAALAEREAVRQWVYARIAYEDYAYVRDLPTELEMDVEGYGKLAAFHASPGDDEAGIVPATPDADVENLLAGVTADWVLVGHTHVPFDRQVGGWRVLNPGSVGFPYDGDPRASYALLEFEDGELRFEVRRVAYDVEKEIAQFDALGHPGKDRMSARLRNGSR